MVQRPGPFVHTPIAFNFASESSNKIHDDATARRFGFAGGLVPGVASYGYLVHPVVDAFGDDWCARGSAAIRLTQPVYEGDRVTARATWTPGREGRRAELDLLDGKGARCAEGWAALDDTKLDDPKLADQAAEDDLPVPNAAAYAAAPLPELDQRPAASLEVLAPSTTLGSLAIGPWTRQELAAIAEQYRDPSPRYTAEARRPALHPAHLLHEANQILVRNVVLGPWIHTASRVRHLREVDCARQHVLRGRVEEAAERRGHEIVTLDLALFDDADRAVAAIRHTAIIRPRQVG